MKIYQDNIEEFLLKIKDRNNIDNISYLEIVKNIIKDIKINGNSALIEYTNKFDSELITLDNIRVTKEEIKKAYDNLDPILKETYEKSYERIKAFHELQKTKTWMDIKDNGEILGQKITPLESVGIYVPGGKAAYPSTVFMNAVPAIVAGVERIIMTTPANKAGEINQNVLACAYILGIEEIYKVGGAQAIAALAYGSTIIPKVCKIVGPGNIFVALAKKEVFGSVSIDSVAGPSEILVLADETANPRYVAADLLSQAEHDELASSILITNSVDLANEVNKYVLEFTEKLERKNIINKSLDNFGGIIVCQTMDEAIRVANDIAPEHLELASSNPFIYLPKIKNAGAIFLGNYTPESLGDYMAGPNHVLPTNQTAKFFSPLSVDDFIKKSSILYFNSEAFDNLGEYVYNFANSEGLTAHALASKIRMEDK